jgi:hypothetical protein
LFVEDYLLVSITPVDDERYLVYDFFMTKLMLVKFLARHFWDV